jgi:methionyl-tRNA synthetase
MVNGTKLLGARVLITSALPYINSTKHLGNLAGSILPADVFARFCRQLNKEVLFLCATDEHGTPTELAAAEAGLPVREFADRQHAQFRSVLGAFGISFDWFGRTSSNENAKLVQHLAERLEERGLIDERESVQLYSAADGRFLPDRYVEGTCPHCGYGSARGDQCDQCGELLDPLELIAPRSKISGSTELEKRATRHLFLLQSKLQGEVRAWVDDARNWPPLARSIAYKWLDEGLQDRSITRDLHWGIPVLKEGKTRPGFEKKVFYVWFDAPIEYMASAIEWANNNGADWRRWWRTDEGADDVFYAQFMGKDNVAFHTVSFPATVIGSGEPWKMVDALKAFNWVTWYGDKFSTSQQRGIFLDQALEILPPDYWRWYLTVNSPESSDAPFTLEQLQATVNSDLANVFGNFVNRTLSLCKLHFDSRVPAFHEFTAKDEDFLCRIDDCLIRLKDYYESMQFRKAALEVRTIWALGNEYISVVAPWTAIKTDRVKAGSSLNICLNLCLLFGEVSHPIIPSKASEVIAALTDGKTTVTWPIAGWRNWTTRLEVGAPLQTLRPLFDRIPDEDIAEWRLRFAAP